MTTSRLQQLYDDLASFSQMDQDLIAAAIHQVLSQVRGASDAERAEFLAVFQEIMDDSAAQLTHWTDHHADETLVHVLASVDGTSAGSSAVPATPLIDRLQDIESRMVQAAHDMGLLGTASAQATVEGASHVTESSGQMPAFHDVVRRMQETYEPEPVTRMPESAWSPDVPRLHAHENELARARRNFLRELLVEVEKVDTQLRREAAKRLQADLQLSRMIAKRRGKPLPTTVPDSVPDSVLIERAQALRDVPQLDSEEETAFLSHLNMTDRGRYIRLRSALEGDQVVLELFQCLEQFALVLIPAPTGIIFQQQCSGLRCDHKRLEGLVLPVLGAGKRARYLQPPALGPELARLHSGCCSPLSQIEALQINLILLRHRVPLRVDYTRLADSTEAWVWVIIDNSVPAPDFAPFVGQSVVLLYQNCD